MSDAVKAPQLSRAEAALAQRAALAMLSDSDWRAIRDAWRKLKGNLSPQLSLIEEREDGGAYEGPAGIRLIVSVSLHGGHMWAHISASYASALPGWAIMKRVKRWTVGADAKAIMILPPEAEHVNIHSFVHHLWCCLSGDVLPDFSMGTRTI